MLQFFLFLLLITSMIYLSIINKQLPSPSLTTVRNQERELLSDEEKIIYDYFTSQGYYVSCRVACGIQTIPLALVPFRIAILPKKDGKAPGLLVKCYYKLRGWKVYFLAVSDGEKMDLDNLKLALKEARLQYGNGIGKVQ
ncbi:hypothetical protein [Evansella tamaricis]|uniref:Uncharacterized protein n=1 Tax=Evansella tamaricis TaxID=2069301 RepID=A0ABS6JBB5_9BACI|nr:hypothetical protein [Evansella tamaricis]MBU9710969.1 hypothetical protein [Evansella tamaricis]